MLTINGNSVTLPYSLIFGMVMALLATILYVQYYGSPGNKYRFYAFAWPFMALVVEVVLWLGLRTLIVACG